jgi:hypothetical protein
MTQPVDVDANDVVDELVAHVGRLAKENAILRAQVKTYVSGAHTIESETPQQ